MARGQRQAHKPAKSRLRLERQRHFHYAFLVRLKGDFLAQHDVACSETALGHEAQAADTAALPVELADILLPPSLDPVALAGLGADDLEGSPRVVLGELLRGEPLAEEDPGLGFGALRRGCSPDGANADADVAFARPQLTGRRRPFRGQPLVGSAPPLSRR